MPDLAAIRPLAAAAFGVHAADQLALAALPLAAALVFGLDEAGVGLLVAAHSAAWLIGSAPAGWLLDHADRRRAARRACLFAALALAGAALAVATGQAAGLALAVVAAAAGPLVFVLAAVALAPALIARDRLPQANARLELARAAATLLAPPIAGALVAAGRPVAAFGLAALCALAAAAALTRLRPGAGPAAGPAATGLFASARQGVVFVARQPLLRGVALCAVLWNLAFFGLAAIFAPFALRAGFGPADVGWAQSAMGAGLLAAGLLAGRIVSRAPPRHVLIAGPATSALAALAILAAGRLGALWPAALGYALLGFAPTLWAVTQTTLRQLVTPPALLGRAGAAIQLAIYGVRPLGAALAGAAAARFGAEAALLGVTLLFAASTLAVLASPLARLARLPAPVSA